MAEQKKQQRSKAAKQRGPRAKTYKNDDDEGIFKGLLTDKEVIQRNPRRRRKGQPEIHVKPHPANRPPQARRAAPRKNYRPEGRGFLVDNAPGNQAGTSIMIVPTVLQLDTLYVAAATFFSNLVYRNVIGANEQLQYDVVNGISYMVDAIKTMSEGAQVELGRIPFIFDVLLSLLKEKNVKFQQGLIKYTPQWNGAVSLPLSFNTPAGAVYSFIPPGNLGTVPINYGVTTPSGEAYSEFLRVTGDSSFKSNFGSKIVEQGTAQGLCVVDPSAYARVYTYFGTAGSVGGFYSVCEIEVPTFFPMFSRFVNYNTDDKVISRVFHPQTGGISLPIGLSLTTVCTMSKLKNPIPCQYKFIDFTQFYAIVCSYLVAMFNNIPTNFVGDTAFTKPEQFTFSSLDFAWLLRQSVLAMFPEQCHAQFVTPLAGSPSTQSVFEPLIVDSIVSPSSIASGLMLPAFIVENLSMLRGFTLPVTATPNSKKYGTTPTKLAHTWMPVWGIYSGDVLPQYQFRDPDSGVMINLFAPTDTLPVARLYDGILANNNNAKVNVNEFIANMKSEFNFKINGFCKARSTPVSPMTSDLSSKTNLLSYTRIIEKFLVNDPMSLKPTAVPDNYRQPAYEFMVNGPQKKSKELTKEDSLKNVKGKKPTAIPPATLGELYNVSILAHTPIGLSVAGALDYFLVPSIRLNPSGVPDEDLLTLNAYQTVTGELSQLSYMNATQNPLSSNEFLRILTSSALLNAGFAPGDATNDTLTSAQKIISDHAGGIDFLKSIFGGLASVIPVVGPILSGLIGGS